VKNPSIYGGTYAFVLVDHDRKKGREIYKQSGVYDPNDMGTPVVTNNQMELIAVLLGLQWAAAYRLRVIKVVSDSKVTLGRVFQGWSLKNIPAWMIELKSSLDVRGIHGQFQKGHVGHKWNEMADQMAASAGSRFLVDNGFGHLVREYESSVEVYPR
jgi:ribonuclease HI